MNIFSAATYLKQGYRIKRSSWLPDSFMKLDVLGDVEQYHKMSYHTIDKNGLTKHEYMGGGLGNLSIDDLLAEDWEIIIIGIRKEFSKHEHGIEYEDDTDWDNYVPSKGGWNFDDEEE